MKTLDQLQPGESGIVSAVLGTGTLHQRLREMGVMEGIPVEVIRLAPLGDPLEVFIQGYHLSLRKQEAALVEIQDE